jgi:hypothetical protein
MKWHVITFILTHTHTKCEIPNQDQLLLKLISKSSFEKEQNLQIDQHQKNINPLEELEYIA